MNFAPYSASKINLYKQCTYKFKLKFIDKVKVPFVPNVALVKGNIIHSFLEHHEKPTAEKIAIIKKDKQLKNSMYFTPELIKECFKIYNSFTETTVGKELFSYTDLGAEISIGLDKKLDTIGFLEEGVMYRGYIDRVFVNQGTDTVYIVDWKTGSDKSDGMFKQEPDQLIYYANWYFSKFPVNSVIIRFVFVEHENKYLDYELTRENLNKYKKLLVQNIVDIEKNTTYEKTISKLCEYCEYLEMCNPKMELH